MPFLAALQHEPLITAIPNEPNTLVPADVVAIPAAERLRIILCSLNDVPASEQSFIE
jgi:hypothetical protein